MIDRKARDRMAVALESYMNEEITAFELDDALWKVMDSTDDETVEYIGCELWYHYDDCKDHKIVASKEGWDYFHRLLLLLKSDGEISHGKARCRFTVQNLIAASCFVAFVGLVIHFGFGEHLLLVSIPFGVVSMLLHFWNEREGRKRASAAEIARIPFPSIASLFMVRRSVPTFVKKRYPIAIKGRRIRGPIHEKIMFIPAGIMWLLFAPVVLLFQMLPKTHSETRIIIREAAQVADQT